MQTSQITPGKISTTDVITKETKTLITPDRFENVGGPVLAPDGRSLFYTSAQTRSDIWMLSLP
ncbi:MAG: PD40 domain-containing protein [Acidobacteria bacterium]|nr:PD40 domain-containing protein [Acidobacteriota bacterium]